MSSSIDRKEDGKEDSKGAGAVIADDKITVQWRVLSLSFMGKGDLKTASFDKEDAAYPFAKFLVENKRFYHKLMFGSFNLGYFEEMHLSDTKDLHPVLPTADEGQELIRTVRQMLIEHSEYGSQNYGFNAFARIDDKSEALSVGRMTPSICSTTTAGAR